MSDPTPSADDSAGTLYDPPDTAEETPVADNNSVDLRVSLSQEVADRLQAVAHQLGLTPSTVAQRAVEMVCSEVTTIQEDGRPPDLMVEQYQARIDLLHSVEEEAEASVPTNGQDEDAPQPPENSSKYE